MQDAADLVIVGGGPAGMMAGLLFARAGVETLVLEKHRDFLRDFRGDTVHPSTMEIIAELGLLDAFLARPHHRLEEAQVRFGNIVDNPGKILCNGISLISCSRRRAVIRDSGWCARPK